MESMKAYTKRFVYDGSADGVDTGRSFRSGEATIRYEKAVIDSVSYRICQIVVKLQYPHNDPAKTTTTCIMGESAWDFGPYGESARFHDKRTAMRQAADAIMAKLAFLKFTKGARKAVFAALCPQYVNARRPRYRNLRRELAKLSEAVRRNRPEETRPWAKEFVAQVRGLLSQAERNVEALDKRLAFEPIVLAQDEKVVPFHPSNNVPAAHAVIAGPPATRRMAAVHDD